MNTIESFKTAFESILSNKLRSFLTMLGIIIGVASVIAVIAIGEGGRNALQYELEKFGINRFVIFYNWSQDNPITTLDNFTNRDIQAIQELSPAVNKLVPVSYERSTALYRGRETEINARGTTSEYTEIIRLLFERGRFFTEQDNISRRYVGVVSYSVVEELFAGANPIGERIIVNNNPITVIGVLQKEESAFGMDDDRPMVFMPFNSFVQIFNNDWIDNLHGSAVSQDMVDEAMSQAISILERRHRCEGKYRAHNIAREIEMAQQISRIVALIVGSIAAISLIVGGIGIMNIMLVSVTERTREIGLRKALGATRKDILIQFLIESVSISVIGGIIGMFLGLGGAVIVSYIANWPPLISWTMVIIAFIFSTVIGIFFGLYPANKAAKLEPIDALRYE